MKSTVHFKNTIKEYLDRQAAEDALFATVYANPNKNIDDCIVYILNTVQKSGCNGFHSDEIFSMAVHYWTENNVEAGKPIDCQVIINRTVELTAEEKEEARRKATQRATDEAYNRMKQTKGNHRRKLEPDHTPNLFNF